MSSSTAGESDQTLTERLLQYLRRYQRDDVGKLATKWPNEQRTLTVDLMRVFQHDRTIHDDIIVKPDQVRERFEEALRLFDLPADLSNFDPNVRFSNVPSPNTYDVGAYSNRQIGEMLGVRGQVNKRSEKRTRIVEAAFECQRCGTMSYIPQNDTGFQEPHECSGCERQGPFRVNHSQSEFVDDQLIRVQLPPEKAQGRSDASVDIQLEEDMVNSVSPGDRVRADMILDVVKTSDDKPLFDFIGKGEDITVEETDFTDVEVTEEDLERIKEIVDGDPYQAIVDSIAPTLRGLEKQKLAVGMLLFGGTEKKMPDGSTERGNSHMLLIGDPGTGKTALLRWANKMAPRSVFSDGKGSSSAGITAAAVRDDFGGKQWTIEGGTIVKAHNGLACIDELDDMDPEDRSALHTALETQRVPVAKAGINTELPAKATLLAAANPKHGRFDIYEDIPDQINLNPALMSRFDLIFTFKDVPKRKEDEEIVHHKATSAEVGQRTAAGEDVPPEKLNEVAPEIEPALMRSYIAHAKREVTPVFSEPAKQKLEREFVELRQANVESRQEPEDNPVPVTYRKQEGITRLAEASARIRLSDTITVEDIDRALTLVMKSMADVGMDKDSGQFDADIVETGTSMSQRERIKQVKNTVAEVESGTMDGAHYDDIIDALTDTGISEKKAKNEFKTLQRKGEVYEPKDSHYRTT